MSPLNSLFLKAVVAAALGVAMVLACGPFFGIEVLTTRKQVLLAPPTVSFERELRALVPKPQDELPVAETEDQTRETIEAKELAPDVLDRVKKMREQLTGDAAYGLGDGLGAAVREYTSGAVSFLHGDTDGARVHFQTVVSLPEAEQRRSRELWAHFMLGRMAVQRREQEEAVRQFEATRAVVRNGMPDPLGLALASYGEEARGAWQQGAVAQAVDLYATQAAYGSETALNSLVTVAWLILKDDNLLDKGIQDPKTRRLLFVCLNGNNGSAFFIGPNSDDLRDDEAATALKNSSFVDRVVAALERHVLRKVDGAALLASAAYRAGRFDLAAKLSAMEDVPLSEWVQAKLALRRGDRDAALSAYQRALEGFAASDGNASEEVRDLRAETGVLRVSRGDYVQALDLFYGNAAKEMPKTDEGPDYWNGFEDYWGDAAYLAERVLTVDELRGYVDRSVPALYDSKSNPKPASAQLRSLLARRLMRDGQRAVALRYFDDLKVRETAKEYGHALEQAQSHWHANFVQAGAWFRAAQIARESGMEILGFERAPDWAMWNGNYEPYEGPDDLQAAARKKPKPKDEFESDDERKRAEASKPQRDVRYQYRLTAVDHATKAADLLPVKSQAFAAVLCEASAWVIDREPKRAEEIYARYLRSGAYVRWGGGFARTCPAPDFGVSSVYGLSRKVQHLKRHARVHPVYAGLGALAGVGMIGAAFYFGWWRRRCERSFKNV